MCSPLVICLRLKIRVYGQRRSGPLLKSLRFHISGQIKPNPEEMKGDIYVAKGEPVKAADAYREALIKAKAGSRNVSLLEMKMDDLGKNNQ